VSYSGTDPFALNTLNTDRNTSGSFTAADLDASVKLENTFTVTSSSNTLTDSVEGVTLNLVAVGTTTVKVERNTAGIQSSVQAMTKAYSSLISTMAKMKGDVLKTDTSAVSNMADQLRNVLSTNVSVGGSFSNAFQIGISTQKTGTLALDSTVLNNAITNDPEGFASLFSDTTNGLAVRLTQLADRFLATNGVLDGRSQGLDSAIQSATAQKERLTQRLTVVKARLTKQYNSLDSLVSGLQRTGNLVTQQLDTLTAAQRK
jgi:flagellar hook-associated protein 2